MVERMSMETFFYGTLLIFSGGFLAEFFPIRFKAFVFSVFAILGSLLTLVSGGSVLLFNQVRQATCYFQYPVGETHFLLDPLAGFFVLIFSIVYPIVSIYSASYISRYQNGRKERLYYFNMSLLMVAMLFVVTSQNALLFLIVWELMTLSSFLLTTFDHEKKEVFDAALYYLIAMHVGALFLIGAFSGLILKTGSNDMALFKSVLNSDKGLLQLFFLLIFIGFGTKAGFFPFHSWLPKAHPAAPSPVSAIMSGLMLKTGIYGILRFVSYIELPVPAIGYSVLAVSLFTAVFGIIYAMNAKDIKKQLAYSSIENIGIIGIGIGVGILGQAYGNPVMSVWGYGGAALHILNHSIFKSSLFMMAGTVYWNLHTRDMEKMGGLAKYLPKTSAFFIISSVAISGLPPLNGFISEFCLYLSMLSGIKTSAAFFVILIAAFALLAFIGALAVIAFTKAVGVVFLGQPRTHEAVENVRESSGMFIPPLILTVLALLAGAFPQFLFGWINPLLQVLLHTDISVPAAKAVQVLSSLATAVWIFYGLLALLSLVRVLFRKKSLTDRYKTWDCGYQAGSPRVQYTASSYTLDAEAVLTPLLYTTTELEKPEGLFPQPSAVNRHSFDFIDQLVHYGFKQWITRFFNLVSVIQSRNTQQYVIYVILFIILTFIWIMVMK